MSATVYGKSVGCVWCDRAKVLLETNGISFEFKDVAAPGILTELKKELPMVRTVPQIWVDGIYIGGYDDLEKYIGTE